MGKGRLEAFSDGVIAIIITILVLEIKVPHGDGLDALRALAPVMLAYGLAFVNVGLFWNNHHHMLHLATRIDGTVLWANMSLLFFLSLVPFTIRWMDEAHYGAMPVAAYGVTLFGAACGYIWLERSIIRADGPGSKLAQALTSNWKEKISFAMYALAMPLAFVHVAIALALYVASALIWLVPDRRIERLGA